MEERNTEECEHTHIHEGYSDKMKEDLKKRLNRIEGQIRGIKRLIDEDTYCDDILTQVSSVQAALNGINKKILENHIETCVVDRLKNDDPKIVEEFLKTIGRMTK